MQAWIGRLRQAGQPHEFAEISADYEGITDEAAFPASRQFHLRSEGCGEGTIRVGNDQLGDAYWTVLTQRRLIREEKALLGLASRAELSGANRSGWFFHVLFNQVEEIVVSRLRLWLDGGFLKC